MKRLLLILILNYSFLIVNCFSQQYGWVDISSNIPPFPYDTTIINNGQDTIIAGLTDIHFINDNEGWITTWHPFWDDSAAVLHTTDGGNRWEVQMIQISCNAIWMINENEGYAGGQGGGIIYRTTDGGSVWNIHGVLGTTLTDITFPSQPADTGYACGFDGAISMITLSGVTPMTSGVVSDLDALSFPVSSAEGWVVGGSIIRHFTGGNWVADQIGPSGGYNGVHFVDSQNGWAVGDKIIHTSDGTNWTMQPNHPALLGTLLKVYFLNSDEGWVVGTQGQLFHTTNEGNNWEGIELNTTEFLVAVQFTSSTNGYVVGNNKTLLKYTQLTSVEEELSQPTEFKLEQNYPNPFNPSTKISWQSPVSNWQTLKVYDVLGNEVATLVDEYKPAGRYEVEFNGHSDEGQNLSSGVYFYQLSIRDPEINSGQGIIQTKKMILMK